MVRSISVPVTHFLRLIFSLPSFNRLTLLTYNSVTVNVFLPILHHSSGSQKFLRRMEDNKSLLQSLFALLKKLPLWLRLVVLLSLAVAAAWSVSSCANTKAVVRASSENTSASVTITTNNPTTVNVTNNQDTIGLNFNPRK